GKYIPVFVNTDTDAGKRLARAFEMSSGKGIVISDRTGALQAFWHEGDLSNQNLARYLQRYSDPNLAVRTTEMNPSQPVSYYGPEGHAKGGPPAGGCCAPAMYAGGCGGSSCGSHYASSCGGRHRCGGGRMGGRCGGCGGCRPGGGRDPSGPPNGPGPPPGGAGRFPFSRPAPRFCFGGAAHGGCP